MNSAPRDVERGQLPPSLWAETVGETFEAEPLAGADSVDAVVIGGGFCGLSAALHLAKAGVATMLLETHEIGWGASGRNGGQIISCFKDDPEALIARHGPDLGERMNALGAAAGDLVSELIARYAIRCDFALNGTVMALHGAAMIKTYERKTRQWQARGLPVRMLDTRETTALLGTDKYALAYLDPRGGGLNPLAFARGLARGARQEGVRIHTETPATSISRAGDRWRITTPCGEVLARWVLIATGAYSGDLVPKLRRSVMPVQSIQVSTRPLPPELRATILPQRTVVADTRRLLHYFRYDGAGRFVFGGRGSLGDDKLAPTHVKAIVAGMRATYPQLTREPIEHAWAGHIDITADRRLRVHELAPRLVAVIGLNGRGVALAPAVGKALGEALSREMLAELPLPVTTVRPMPGHAFRRPAMATVAGWYRLLDSLDKRSAIS